MLTRVFCRFYFHFLLPTVPYKTGSAARRSFDDIVLNVSNDKQRMEAFANLVDLLEEVDRKDLEKTKRDNLDAETKKRKEGVAQERGGNQTAQLFKKMKAASDGLGGGSEGGGSEDGEAGGGGRGRPPPGGARAEGGRGRARSPAGGARAAGGGGGGLAPRQVERGQEGGGGGEREDEFSGW